MPARPAALALLAVAIAAAGVAGPPATNATEASVVGVYPDPAADGDTGEFVLLNLPPDSRLGAYSLTDGEGVARPANRTAGGTVALSTAPGRVRALTDYRVVALRGDLALANGGDRVTLRRRGVAVDSLAYRD
ncbi:MAG: phospholipase, partial [Halobacteriaceae archaeon]